MPSSAIAEGKGKRSEAVEVKEGLLELPSILSINTRFQGLEMILTYSSLVGTGVYQRPYHSYNMTHLSLLASLYNEESNNKTQPPLPSFLSGSWLRINENG